MLLLKNARICKERNKTVERDVLIDEGKIKLIGQSIKPEAYTELEVIDLEGNLLLPGAIDVHVHLREPGFEYKETILTGTRAAARGGYTTIMPMPNLKPNPDRVEIIEKYLDKISRDALVNVIPYVNITEESRGQKTVDMQSIKEKFGLRFFTDDGVGVQNDEVMEEAFIKSKSIGGLIAAHTEDMRYREKGSSVHAGKWARKQGFIGIPSETEYKQAERDLELAYKTGAKYHICHISAKETVEALRKYKRLGADVSGEVTIHHLLLVDEDVKDTNYKMNPPLRTKEDRDALIEGLLDGTIDFLANDHAPHTEEEKNQTMDKAPFGIVTIEDALSLFYTYFFEKGIISLEDFIRFTSTNPALRYGFTNKGRIEEGYDADLIVLRKVREKIDKDKYYSKGKNTPFNNWEVSAVNDMTIVGGKLVYRRQG
ncbi:dihydroorotase [Peptoniphilaceae bacterium SGI.131]